MKYLHSFLFQYVRLFILIPVILILSYPQYGTARKSTLIFQHITIKQGISQSTVNDIVQDRKGYLWIATEDGLNKYDGYSFKVYRYANNNKSSIQNNYISVLFVDKNGNLWVGTDGGLHQYNEITDGFTYFQYDTKNPSGLSNNFITSICQDFSGQLWIGTKGGLNRYDPKTNTLSHDLNTPNTPKNLITKEINSLNVDSNGLLWIGTQEGLYRYDQNTNTYTYYTTDLNDINSISNNYVKSICADQHGFIWIGTNVGLNRFDPKQNIFKRYQHKPDDPTSISHNEIRDIYEDSLGSLWIATYGGGLLNYDRVKDQFFAHEHVANDDLSISTSYVLSIYEDRSGVLWVGTNLGGINKFVREWQHFNSYRNDPMNPNSLSDNNIWAIVEDVDGILWIGSNRGLDKMHRSSDSIVHYQNIPGNLKSLENDIVRAICIDKRGTLWIGTNGAGVARFDQTQEAFIHYQHNPDDPTSLSHNEIRVIYEDKKGVLWVGTNGGGLNKLDTAQQKFQSYQHDPSNPHSLSDNSVWSLFEDSAGQLWVGTINGLNRMDANTKQFQVYQNNPENPSTISHNWILTIYEDHFGHFWIGTVSGLNQLDRSKGIFTYYGEKDGLLNEVIYGILEDTTRHLWMSTNKGLSKFNLTTHTFKNYEMVAGLDINEYNAGAYYQSNQTGEMFFGCINGLHSFFPENIKDNPKKPPVVITDFQIFNKSVINDVNLPYRKAILQDKYAVLSYKDYVISFEFSALHFINPMKNVYAYILEGFEQNWNYSDASRRFATYTNLPGGEYIFRIKAANNDYLWNETGEMIRIRVIPPFWETLWFKMIMLISIAFLSFTGFKIRIRVIEKQKKRLEMIVEQRTIELRYANQNLEKRNHFIKQTFGRYLSDEIVENILETEEGLNLGGEKREVTIMMSDLRGFTAIGEHLSPEKVVGIINIYLEIMTEIIIKYNGTIDEIIGDALLIIFGAPIMRDDDPLRAVSCALEMQLAMKEVNDRCQQAGYTEVQMGIGINTGSVVVGNIGSKKRVKYGVVGRNVNLTSRIESYTVSGQVFISEKTKEACGDILRIDDVLEVMPKGVKHPIFIYEIGGIGGEYQIYLPEKKPLELVVLSLPLQVYFNELADKHASNKLFTGTITQISPKGAEMISPVTVEKLTNIKLILSDSGEDGLTGEIYAKVVHLQLEKQAILSLYFTSVSPDADLFIARLLRYDNSCRRGE
ncbi:MAG: histidine kinase [Desulfobacterales bacterium]|nr:histidine kinase [Desulfobacterales bacterium]